MKSSLNVIVLIGLVATTTYGSTLFQAKESNHFGGLKAIQQIEESKFGRQLLDTIALQMKNETPLQEIAALLADIRADLVSQQKADDTLQEERRVDCELSIADFEARIATAVDNIATAVQTINTLRGQITDLKVLISNYETQMALVAAHDAQVRADRATDAASFSARSAKTEQTVEALQMIIPRLRSLGPQSAATALAQLAKIGKSNPIASFMEVASTIDGDKLAVVVDKMQGLLESLQASLVEDSANEQSSQASFLGLINDLQATADMLSAAHATATSNLEQAESKLSSQERFLEEQQAEEAAARAGLAAKKEQCALWEANYQSTKESRSAERSVVEQVQQILAERLQSMSAYLKERVDHDF